MDRRRKPREGVTVPTAQSAVCDRRPQALTLQPEAFAG